MAAYLASDGAIKPTKIVSAEALKQGADLGKFLCGGPFAACAQMYRNLNSSYDFDASWFIRNNNTRPSNTSRSMAYHSRPTVIRSGDSRSHPFPIGYCYSFQKGYLCLSSDCRFMLLQMQWHRPWRKPMPSNIRRPPRSSRSPQRASSPARDQSNRN